MSRFILALVATSVILLASCATLSHGSSQEIQVASDPPGAQVLVDNDPVPYATPTTIMLNRRDDHVLVFRKNGYQDYRTSLTRSTSGAVAGNLVVGGIVGAATDYSSGAAYTLSSADLNGDVLTAHLAPNGPGVSAPSPAAHGVSPEESDQPQAPSAIPPSHGVAPDPGSK